MSFLVRDCNSLGTLGVVKFNHMASLGVNNLVEGIFGSDPTVKFVGHVSNIQRFTRGFQGNVGSEIIGICRLDCPPDQGILTKLSIRKKSTNPSPHHWTRV
jgi:hypothetical protein